MLRVVAQGEICERSRAARSNFGFLESSENKKVAHSKKRRMCHSRVLSSNIRSFIFLKASVRLAYVPVHRLGCIVGQCRVS